MRFARVVEFVGLLAVLAALSGCGETKPAQASAPVAPASMPAPSAPADTAFVASGPLVVENQVDLAAERAGLVAKIMAEPGTRVKKGQLLALLDDRQISAERDAAAAKTRSIDANIRNFQAEVQVLQADYDRARKMWEAQLITKEQLEHAQYKLDSDKFEVEREKELLKGAQADYRALELEFEKTHIRAPFDGVVARRYVRVGQKVALGDRLFWVTAESPLRIKFTLPEKFVGRVQRGEPLTVYLPYLQERTYKANVIAVSPVVDPSSGTIEVVAEFVGGTSGLRPGMTANIRLDQTR
ncbi:MAG TPA: efflux RND transporter periplasmic adaptor subunit [Terriglobales bacterium]|nr:efflux RND transporter periplasmic adaptor subunit [Terriglobales bacterium]